jgi:hypothetical protein
MQKITAEVFARDNQEGSPLKSAGVSCVEIYGLRRTSVTLEIPMRLNLSIFSRLFVD